MSLVNPASESDAPPVESNRTRSGGMNVTLGLAEELQAQRQARLVIPELEPAGIWADLTLDERETGGRVNAGEFRAGDDDEPENNPTYAA
jgi:hypothetical protein